jgi:hypothetical protein
MRFGTVGIVAVLLLIIPGVVRAVSDETPDRPLLVIRTYNIYGISREDLWVAQDSVEATLKDAGIDVRWLDCGQKNIGVMGESLRCRQTPASNELLLRIQAKGPVGGSRNVSMGFSVVSRRPEDFAPFFSTVFADVVASVARDAGVDARRLLGYAFAHEIGHLLLNSPRHSEAGLMRAPWSRFELQGTRTADWVFLSEEAETMRQAIAARTRVRLGGVGDAGCRQDGGRGASRAAKSCL